VGWTRRFLNMVRRGTVDAEIEEELRFHLDERTRDNVAAA
jgi:hypothetical protein